MVEALSASFQNLYNKYTRSDNVENAPQNNRDDIYIVPVNRNVAEHQQDHDVTHRYRPKGRKMFVFNVKELCQTKEMAKWQILKSRKMRPFAGQCCSICIPNTMDNSRVESNLKNLLDGYNIGLVQKSMFGSFVDSLKFFYQQKNQEYRYIFDEVLEDESVHRAIFAAASQACTVDNEVDHNSQKFNEQMELQRKNSICILTVMSAKVKNWVYKVVGWFTFRMVSLLATSLVVQPHQIDRVREAEQSGLPVIYLPLHRSHMDYILLGLVLTMHNIKPPLVAAGENLRVFFISKLLSYLGAFYIKRQDTKKDQLYWSILSSYIKNSMKGGHHLEFFLEGARTRSGKCCVPKGGLLSIVVDAYREGVIDDAWIVPVSMNYDKILEGNFVQEELGQNKKNETFFSAISTCIKAICSHYGIMRVDFNNQYRLRDLYESINKKIKLENDLLGSEKVPENIHFKCTVDEMAKHIVYDCWKSTAIMSTNAVCFLLLKKFRNGVTLEQLAEELSALREKLSQANRDIGFSGKSEDVVKHALTLISPKLVVYEKTDSGLIVKPILNVPSLIELSYYGNSLLSFYLHKSIVALSLSKIVPPEFWNHTVSETKISRVKLLEWVTFLIELLQFDFIFVKPCDSLDNVVDSVIRHFEEEEIVLIKMLLEEEQHCQKIANFLDSDSEDDIQQTYVQYDVEYRINADANSLNKIKFYRSILMPYLECMAESAASFLTISCTSVEEREHIQTIIRQMNENLEEGILFHGESISVESIKHSFLAFEKFNCLAISTKDNIKTLSMVDNKQCDLIPKMQAISDCIEDFLKQI